MYGFAVSAKVVPAAEPATASTTWKLLRRLLVVRFDVGFQIVFTRRG